MPNKVLWPDKEIITIRTELLKHDLILLDTVESRLADLESRLVALLPETPYQIWTRLKGLSNIQVASLAAALGDPAHYTHASQVFRRSGLVSGRADSGVRQSQGKGQPIVKTGDVYLRRALMNALDSLLLNQPVLHRYYSHLKLTKPRNFFPSVIVYRAI